MSIGVVDLFCGVGGLTCGLQSAGIKVVAGIDLDTSCKFAYSYNNNSEFISRSIDSVSGKDIKRLLKGYDIKVLVGCAPCQPFSSHQKDKKNRSSHKDWNLLYEFGRLVRESKPHIVSMENVPELAKEKVFIDFVETLKSEKYFVNYKVVNVADYGVPQRRKRLILLASRKKPIKIIDKTHETYITVQDAIGELPPINAGEKSEFDRLHVAPSLSHKNIKRIENSFPGGTWKDWPEELVLKCHKEESGKSYTSVYGRMRWDDLSPTITTQYTYYGTGRFGHPSQDRAITLREGAILQSFPPTYSFVTDDEPIVMKKIARHIGNAVPPRLGEIIGLSILEYQKNRKTIRRNNND